MTTTIAVISDTHFNRWDEVHPKIKEAVRDADIAVHCGDIVRQDVVDGMRREAKRAVHSPRQLRPPPTCASPSRTPRSSRSRASGSASPTPPGAAPNSRSKNSCPTSPNPWNAILFGHIHEPVNETRDGILFLNPGQAYKSFMVPATIATLTVRDGHMTAEIVIIEE